MKSRLNLFRSLRLCVALCGAALLSACVTPGYYGGGVYGSTYNGYYSPYDGYYGGYYGAYPYYDPLYGYGTLGYSGGYYGPVYRSGGNDYRHPAYHFDGHHDHRPDRDHFRGDHHWQGHGAAPGAPPWHGTAGRHYDGGRVAGALHQVDHRSGGGIRHQLHAGGHQGFAHRGFDHAHDHGHGR